MNKYIIAILLSVILVLASFLFREYRKPVYIGFPVHEKPAETNDAPILNLYLFFSKNDCISCMEKKFDWHLPLFLPLLTGSSIETIPFYKVVVEIGRN